MNLDLAVGGFHWKNQSTEFIKLKDCQGFAVFKYCVYLW